jgi:hypothetical protein
MKKQIQTSTSHGAATLQARHSPHARPNHVACIRNVTERVPHEREKLNSNHEQHENCAVNLDCRENGQDLSRNRTGKPSEKEDTEPFEYGTMHACE